MVFDGGVQYLRVENPKTHATIDSFIIGLEPMILQKGGIDTIEICSKYNPVYKNVYQKPVLRYIRNCSNVPQHQKHDSLMILNEFVVY